MERLMTLTIIGLKPGDSRYMHLTRRDTRVAGRYKANLSSHKMYVEDININGQPMPLATNDS
jgi:hypothetical protein